MLSLPTRKVVSESSLFEHRADDRDTVKSSASRSALSKLSRTLSKKLLGGLEYMWKEKQNVHNEGDTTIVQHIHKCCEKFSSRNLIHEYIQSNL